MKPQQKSSWKISSVITAGVLCSVMGLGACGPNAKNHDSVQGGVDGSGGNASMSTDTAVLKVSEDLKPMLQDAFHRIFILRQEAKQSRRRSGQMPTGVDQIESILARFPQEPAKMAELIERMKIEPIDRPCRPKDKTHSESAMSAQGVMCLSSTLLKRIPESSLEKEVLALGAHEAAHLAGLNETDAQALQDWFLAHSPIVMPNEKEYTALNAALWGSWTDLLNSAWGFAANEVSSQCQALNRFSAGFSQGVRGSRVDWPSQQGLVLSSAVEQKLFDLEEKHNAVQGKCYDVLNHRSKADGALEVTPLLIALHEEILATQKALESYRTLNPVPRYDYRDSASRRLQNKALIASIRGGGKLAKTDLNKLSCVVSDAAANNKVVRLGIGDFSERIQPVIGDTTYKKVVRFFDLNGKYDSKGSVTLVLDDERQGLVATLLVNGGKPNRMKINRIINGETVHQGDIFILLPHVSEGRDAFKNRIFTMDEESGTEYSIDVTSLTPMSVLRAEVQETFAWDISVETVVNPNQSDKKPTSVRILIKCQLDNSGSASETLTVSEDDFGTQGKNAAAGPTAIQSAAPVPAGQGKQEVLK